MVHTEPVKESKKMTDFGINILIIALLLLLNGILAMSEAALLTVSKARLQHMKNEGNKRAGDTLKLISDPNQFLSTIQVGITLIDVLTGAIGGAAVAGFLSGLLSQIEVLKPYSETISLVVVVMVITYFSIVFGELVPKRMAIHNPERVATRAARPMLVISKIAYPLVRVLSGSTDLILRLFGIRHTARPAIKEEEVQVLLAQGTQAGIFEESEQDMVEGVFSLSDRRVSSMMTPRNEIVWLDINDTNEEIRNKIAKSPFSRFPVAVDSLDYVIGVVRAKHVLLADMKSGKQLKQIAHPPVYIPETAFGSRALEMFKETKTDLMLVVDEFGVVQGVLTLSDVVEEIVGELTTDEPQATQRQDGSWLLDGMLSAEDFKEIFKLKIMPDEEEYETLGGFVMLHLGRIPRPADDFEWNGLRFEVMDMDDKRVDKVLVTALPSRTLPSQPDQEETKDTQDSE